MISVLRESPELRNELRMVQLLVDAGADISALDRDPLCAAIATYLSELAKQRLS